jgi:hypothetical protein
MSSRLSRWFDRKIDTYERKSVIYETFGERKRAKWYRALIWIISLVTLIFLLSPVILTFNVLIIGLIDEFFHEISWINTFGQATMIYVIIYGISIVVKILKD